MTCSSGHVARNVARKPSGREGNRFLLSSEKSRWRIIATPSARGEFNRGGDLGGGATWVLSELSDGVGEVVPSAAKLFLVGGGEGISARTAASWGGVVRWPWVAVATVNPGVSSNEGGVNREGLPALRVSWD